MKPNKGKPPEKSAAAIICAAGASRRMGGVKKEYLPFPPRHDLSVLGASVAAFSSLKGISPIVITLPPSGKSAEMEAKAALPPELFSGAAPRVFFVEGGATRRVSVHNALIFLTRFSPSLVLIHDGARPWVTPALIERVVSAAEQYGAAIPALPLTETPKELDADFSRGEVFVARHLRRSRICAAQTPQAFLFPRILEAHEKAAAREQQDGTEYTDDAEVWGEFSGPVAVIEGESENRKITWPCDILVRPAGS